MISCDYNVTVSEYFLRALTSSLTQPYRDKIASKSGRQLSPDEILGTPEAPEGPEGPEGCQMGGQRGGQRGVKKFAELAPANRAGFLGLSNLLSVVQLFIQARVCDQLVERLKGCQGRHL